MKSIYAKFSLLFLLLVSMTVPLVAKLEHFVIHPSFDPKFNEDRKRLFNEFKDLDVATFQKVFDAANLTKNQMSAVLDAFLDPENKSRDTRDKILFLAGKVKDKSGYTLLWAYDKNDRQMIKKLRALGYDSSDALRLAVVYGNHLIPMLLKEGAQPDFKVIRNVIHYITPIPPVSLMPDQKQRKEWFQRAKYFRLMLPRLLKSMKNINERSRIIGETVLFWINGDKAIADQMLKAGVDINAQDKRGNTVLISDLEIVVLFGKKDKDLMRRIREFVPYLIKKGADPMIKNKKGESALSLAKKAGLKDLVLLFEGKKKN